MLNKFERFLFYVLLFSIPFQTRKILWQQEWYFNEWQSISLYFTDLVLLTLFLFWVYRGLQGKSISNFQFPISNKLPILNFQLLKNPNFYLIIFVLISALSVKNIVGVFGFIKLVEFVLFYFFLKSYAIERFGFANSVLALIAGEIFQAVIAVGQFLKQSDLGLRYLGESVLSPHLTGIASFYVEGEKVIRAYGTTPHPNILAAHLFLAAFAFFLMWLYLRAERSPFRFWLLVLGYPLTLLALFFTFSRTIVFLFFVGFLARVFLARFKFKERYWNARLAQLVVFSLVVVAVFSVFYWPEILSRLTISPNEEAVQLRIFYNQESLKTGLNWFGVGMGNFTNWLMTHDPTLPRYLYQPVHNIYLLIYSETGVLGITAFILFLIFLAREFILGTRMTKLYHYSVFLVFLSLLFIGFFDHFLWTLQQGRFMFWLVLALLTFRENDDIIKS